MTELTDLSDTDASNTAVTGQSTQGNIANMGGMDNLQKAILGMLSRFRNANIFRLRDNSDNTKLLAFSLSGITTATTRTLTAPDASGTLALTSDLGLKGHIYGLTLSNNVTDATNDIDIAAGEASSDGATSILITLASAMTKRLDAAWAVGTGNGGLDTGAIANTTYHLWLIRRPDTGVVDVLFSASATAPTMPADYTQKRRIGSIMRDSGSIRGFVQKGEKYWWKVPVLDVSVTNPGAAAVTRTLSVPTGVSVLALVNALIRNPVTTSTWSGYLSDLATDDLVPGLSAPLSNFGTAGLDARNGQQVEVQTDTSGQIRSRLSASDANTFLYLSTVGYEDARGRA